MTNRYQVDLVKPCGALTVVSGMGKNRGTWDSDHSRSAAYNHAAKLRAKIAANPSHHFAGCRVMVNKCEASGE